MVGCYGYTIPLEDAVKYITCSDCFDVDVYKSINLSFRRTSVEIYWMPMKDIRQESGVSNCLWLLQ